MKAIFFLFLILFIIVMQINKVSTISYIPKSYKRNNVSFSGNIALQTDKFVKSTPVKKDIGTLFSSVISVLNPPKAVTKEDVNNLFIKNGFKKNKNGQFYKKLTALEEQRIDARYGSKSKKIKDYFNPNGQEIQKEFREFLDIGNNYNIAKKNFEGMFIAFSNMYENMMQYDVTKNLFKQRPSYLQLVQNAAQTLPQNKDVVKSLEYYKGCGYKFINDALSSKLTPRPDTLSNIKDISSYIDTQCIKNPIKLYRGTGYDALDNIKLSNGSKLNLGSIMRDAANKNDTKKINKIREYILDNKVKAHNAGFLSTSLDKDIAKDFAKPTATSESGIIFELTTKPNTKGAYMEALGINNILTAENEVLLQKGSDITIKDCSFVNGQWIVKGEVSNS